MKLHELEAAMIECRKHNLEVKQIQILMIVAQGDNVTQTELAQNLGIPQATISRNIQRMALRMRKDEKGKFVEVGSGLVESKPDLYYAKQHVVSLTDKGRSLIETLKTI